MPRVPRAAAASPMPRAVDSRCPSAAVPHDSPTPPHLVVAVVVVIIADVVAVVAGVAVAVAVFVVFAAATVTALILDRRKRA